MRPLHEQFDQMQAQLSMWHAGGAAVSPDVEVVEAKARWRGRDVRYMTGQWQALKQSVPEFTTDPFSIGPHEPVNPYLRAVVRQPLTPAERPIPVGVVSNAYRLVQHADVVDKCFEPLRRLELHPETLKCEIGLTQLGEWMNFRCYLPQKWWHKPNDGQQLSLRIECFNSVDGSSRLVVLLSWLRLVCTNGLVIRESRAELSAVHDVFLDPDEALARSRRPPPDVLEGTFSAVRVRGRHHRRPRRQGRRAISGRRAFFERTFITEGMRLLLSRWPSGSTAGRRAGHPAPDRVRWRQDPHHARRLPPRHAHGARSQGAGVGVSPRCSTRRA
jgi:hypothetical protein